MDGSDIKGQLRHGVAVVHIPSHTNIYIEVVGNEESNTITRADLVNIRTALDKFASLSWVGIFSDSLSNLHAIRNHHGSPGAYNSTRYHHHILLLRSISGLLEA
jgi:hypothetical protein